MPPLTKEAITAEKKEQRFKATILIPGKIVIGAAAVIPPDPKLESYEPLDLHALITPGCSLAQVVEEKVRVLLAAKNAVIMPLIAESNEMNDMMVMMLNQLIEGVEGIKEPSSVVQIMRKNSICAITALREALTIYKNIFPHIYDDLVQECQKIMAVKRGSAAEIREEILKIAAGPVVVVAKNVAVSDKGKLNGRVVGVVLEQGGPSNHLSVSLKDAGTQGAVGSASIIDSGVKSGDTVIIDGNGGEIIINPTQETLALYRKQMETHSWLVENVLELFRLREVSLREQPVSFMRNAASPAETQAATGLGFHGTGLVRTENIFMSDNAGEPRQAEPSLQEQVSWYSNFMIAAGENELIIRTFDLALDKIPEYLSSVRSNLAKGKQGLTLFFEDETSNPCFFLLRNQLKALLLAAKNNQRKVKIMFPMVAKVDQFNRAVQLVDEVALRLNVSAEDYFKLGAMIEGREIVYGQLAQLAQHLRAEFFSIGTNDLTASITGINRQFGTGGNTCAALDPRVIKALKRIIEVIGATGKPLSVCGDMGDNWHGLVVLLALGLRRISVSPDSLPLAKALVESLAGDELDNMIKGIEKIVGAEEVGRFIENVIDRIIPQHVLDVMKPFLFNTLT